MTGRAAYGSIYILRKGIKMSGMLQNMVENTIDNYIETQYAHLKTPSIVLARVVRTESNGQYLNVTLQILDRGKNPDTDFPEIPDVITNLLVQPEDITVVALAYGECPYILGRWLD